MSNTRQKPGKQTIHFEDGTADVSCYSVPKKTKQKYSYMRRTSLCREIRNNIALIQLIQRIGVLFKVES